MKFDIHAFCNTVVSEPKYAGYDTYLINDNNEMVDYHIYLFIVECSHVAAIICEKLPVKEGSTENYEIYEFNGNKLLDHKVVRIKSLDKNSEKFMKMVDNYLKHKYSFQT
jgi:hypothetical protein